MIDDLYKASHFGDGLLDGIRHAIVTAGAAYTRATNHKGEMSCESLSVVRGEALQFGTLEGVCTISDAKCT